MCTSERIHVGVLKKGMNILFRQIKYSKKGIKETFLVLHRKSQMMTMNNSKIYIGISSTPSGYISVDCNKMYPKTVEHYHNNQTGTVFGQNVLVKNEFSQFYVSLYNMCWLILKSNVIYWSSFIQEQIKMYDVSVPTSTYKSGYITRQVAIGYTLE